MYDNWQPSFEDTRTILGGAYELGQPEARAIYDKIESGAPLYDGDRLDQFVESLQDYNSDEARAAGWQRWTFLQIGTLAASSIEAAQLLSSDFGLVPPRKTVRHEHDQAVLNTWQQFHGQFATDERDACMPFMFSQQDCLKGLAVALHGNSRQQAFYNSLGLAHTLRQVSPDLLDEDTKQFTQLIAGDHGIGHALYLHHETKKPLDEVVPPLTAHLNNLVDRCPEPYKDIAVQKALESFVIDSAAHRQAASYINAQTGTVQPAIRHEERFRPDGSETGMTMDRHYTEVGGHLYLAQPDHIAVLKAALPKELVAIVNGAD